jgi:hypothetical protein
MKLGQRWNKTALHNQILVVISVVAAAAAAVQTYLLELSLEATNRALTASVEGSQSDQRAWIAIESMDITQLEAHKPLTTEVRILNTGKTVALDLHYPGAVLASPVPLDIDTFEKSESMPHTSVPLTAGGLFPNVGETIPAATSAPLTSEEAEAIKIGRMRVYDFGEISYKDIFHRAHTTQFCGVYVLATRKFEDCGQHHSVD